MDFSVSFWWLLPAGFAIALMFDAFRGIAIRVAFAFFGVLRNRVLQVMLPGIVGLYYVTIGTWGDKWAIFKDHEEFHSDIFTALIAASLVVLLLRGLADFFEEKVKGNQIALFEHLARLTANVVRSKLDRFKDEAKAMKPGENPFERITQPKAQINTILREFVALVTTRFGIDENNLCITIMHLSRDSKKGEFVFETNKGWKHTEPAVLIKKGSAAANCLKTGVPTFHADKTKAANSKKYFLSDRDNWHKGIGSVFCYPAFTKINGGEDKYVISVVTYGKTLCTAYDQVQAKAIQAIFSEICRRIDLELTLMSIKTVQEMPKIEGGAG